MRMHYLQLESIRGWIQMNYRELSQLKTFKERFEYLKLNAIVGEATFGFDRWLNQRFYTSKLWRDVRNKVILRDNGCDLGIEGYEIRDKIIIHHLNPITVEDITLYHEDVLLDLDNLICVSDRTHHAIHYGDEKLLPQTLTERRSGDTCPWNSKWKEK